MNGTDESDVLRWQAVAARDGNAVGTFVYGVHSTGIYCTPACSARPSRRAGVSFFDTPEQARLHGFRACRRCDPDHVG